MSAIHDSAAAARARLRLATTTGRALPDGRTGLAVEAGRPGAYDPRPDLDRLAVTYETAAVRLPRLGWLPRPEVHFHRTDVEATRQADGASPPRTG